MARKMGASEHMYMVSLQFLITFYTTFATCQLRQGPRFSDRV